MPGTDNPGLLLVDITITTVAATYMPPTRHR
jgi:hypothetical protein